MSSSKVKSNSEEYELLLASYEKAKARLERAKAKEEASKYKVKAESKSGNKLTAEILELKYEKAKFKRKAAKAGVAVAKLTLKQWFKGTEGADSIEKVEETLEAVAPVAAVETAEAPVKTRRKRRTPEEMEADRLAKANTPKSPRGRKKGSTKEVLAAQKEAAVAVETAVAEAVVEAPEVSEVETPETAAKQRRKRRTPAELEADRLREEAELKAEIDALAGENFTIVEGVGLKMAKALHANGILSFQDLAAANEETLRAILKTIKSPFADPSTWPQQAQYIISGNIKELEALQQTLKRNRRAPKA